MYSIYHIPKRNKIGTTDDVARRMREHNWTGFYEILEEHTCIYKVSDREIELQKQYGYEVDRTPYWQIVERSLKGGLTLSKERASEMGKKSKPTAKQIQNVLDAAKKKRVITYEQAEYIRAQYKRDTDVFGKKITMSRLGNAFGIAPQSIHNIIHNKTYTTP